MTSQRIAGDRLASLKDDLTLTLQQLQSNLEQYGQDRSDSTPLEAVIATIDHIRESLVDLEQRQAVSLLDEMRLIAVGLSKGRIRADSLGLLQQAEAYLQDYLGTFVVAGQYGSDRDLAKIASLLRQSRQPDSQNSIRLSPLQEAMSHRYDALEALKHLRNTFNSSTLEERAEQPQLWNLMQGQLQAIHRLLAGDEWNQATLITERLQRIASTLAAGAQQYRLLAAGLCKEVVVALCHYLEPLRNNRPPAAAVLKEAEEHLLQLETLLQLGSADESSRGLFNLVGSSKSMVDSLPPLDSITAGGLHTSDNLNVPSSGLGLQPKEELLSMDDLSALNFPTPNFGESADATAQTPATVADKEIDLVTLLNLQDGDPEFLEVFLEEAQGELVAIREQLALWRDNLQDREALTAIRRAFHTLKGSGRMVGATVIGDFAWEYESLLNAILSGNLNPRSAICDAVADAVTALAPLVGEVAAHTGALDPLPTLSARARALMREKSEPVTAPRLVEPVVPSSVSPPPLSLPLEALPAETSLPPMESVSDEVMAESSPSTPAAIQPIAPALAPAEPTSRLIRDIDPEFLDVFLEEARQELGNIRQYVALWQQNFSNRQAVSTMRRAFHTLKGSGRVVGATEIGDFAWEFENLLNQILNGNLSPSLTVAKMIAEAGDLLEPLINQVPITTDIQSALMALQTQARTLAEEAEEGPLAVPEEVDQAFESSDLAEAIEPVEWDEPDDWVKPAEIAKTDEAIKPAEITRTEESLKPVEAAEVVASVKSPEVADLAKAAEPIRVTLSPLPVAPVAPAEPTPSPTALPELAVMPGIDQELAEVFQYEATEILDASDLILQKLAGEEAEPTVLLNDLRRNMHTLKGGSRMSGLMGIGDLAHAAESVLDALGKGGMQVSQVVLDTLQQTLDALNRMVAEASKGVNPAATTEMMAGLQRLADAISTGQSLAELPPVTQIAIEPTRVTEDAVQVPESASFQGMTELDQELVQVFQSEASEILDSSDVILQRLREEPSSAELLNNLRREMHTLKGSSRMAGFMPVGDLAHAAESILDALGKGSLQGSTATLDLIQRSLDRLHQMLAKILSGSELLAEQELIDELHGVFGAQQPVVAAKPAAAPRVTASLTTAPVAVAAARTFEKAAASPADSIRVSAALLTNLVNQMGESSIFRARVDQGVSAMSFNLNELEQTIGRLRRQVTTLATQAEARIQSRHDQDASSYQQEFDPLELDRFTELQQVSRSLMEIGDDLSNIGNTLGEHAREVTSLLDQQSKVNKEIQQGLMRTGMVRFGSIVSRLRRVVRQSAQELGKRAELLVSGEEAEVDRNVLENMIAPLEHMLRNSLAHGIEAPDGRRQHGKPEIGTISLSLRREGAELVMELADDGNGLNFEAIRAKGLEKGLIAPDQSVSQEELISLLLRPGFSTATSVTQISGRGVGMDVVHEAIRAMRGALLIQTEPGHGTQFIVRLPFSLAVTQALLAQVGDSLFAIPLLSIELVTRLQETDFKSYLDGDSVQHRYAEREYPIHNLGLLTGIGHVKPFEELTDRRPPALLFRSAEASAALQVEGILGNREIIVKPVGPQFNGVPGISGATVLGDGRVVVVLELAALVRHIGTQAQKQAESRALRVAQQEIRPEKINIMVIDDSITMRKVTARILERHNIAVVTAKDGMDAVAMLQTQVPDLAILDIEMPRMDGFEVVAHVRNQPQLREMPIIMVTSRGGDKHRDRAMKLGVNDYLTKPYQEDQLMESIRRILGEQALGLIT